LLDPGSFRDPDSRVLVAGDAIYRALGPGGLEDWRALAPSRLLAREMEAGRIVATEEMPAPPPGVATALGTEPAAVLRHDRVPFVSYPYEWPFGMLRDAALLQLDLLLGALAEDLILKDSSPYNVQWRGALPVFVDVGSFERLRPGEPWVGYRQFCMLYLYPLLLQAYKGVAFHPWLRGSIEGIAPQDMARLVSLRDRLRRGVFAHVSLHARLERRYAARAGEVKREMRRAGFRKELIEANVRKLRKTVAGLRWEPRSTVWTEYGVGGHSYSEGDLDRKTAFVRQAVATRRWGLAWDLGCNDARFSRIAAEGADAVVAIDSDHETVEHVYRLLRDEGEQRILPLVGNLGDPSPGLGWRGSERRPLADRGRPDLVLALALIHHVTIAGNVPVREFVDWLRELGAALVIEFVRREDPMVQRLLAGKEEDANPDYDQRHFERCLEDGFEVERREELASGTRSLYFARPRSAATA